MTTRGYIAIYKSRSVEVYAESLLEAKEKAIAHFNPSKRDMGILVVMLAEDGGNPPLF